MTATFPTPADRMKHYGTVLAHLTDRIILEPWRSCLRVTAPLYQPQVDACRTVMCSYSGVINITRRSASMGVFSFPVTSLLTQRVAWLVCTRFL